ncbi:unnamed protein product, partial [Penicillium discolor]
MPGEDEPDHQGELHIASTHARPAEQPQGRIEAAEHEGSEQAPPQSGGVGGDDGVGDRRQEQQEQGRQHDAVREPVRARIDHGQQDADREEAAVHEAEEGETDVHPGR